METKKEGILKSGLGVSVIPPQDERSSWTKIIMPNKMKKVFDYFYGKDEQPTYEQAIKWFHYSTTNAMGTTWNSYLHL